MTTYRVQYWDNDSHEWENCSTATDDYNAALRCFRLHAENDPKLCHRLVATLTDVIGSSFRGSEVLR